MESLPTRRLRSGAIRSSVVAVATLALVAGCSSPNATPSPTNGGQSPATSASTAPSGSPSTPPSSPPSTAAAHWESAGTMPVALNEKQAVLLGDGRALVVGNTWEDPETLAELWDPGTGAWKPAESLNKKRSQFAMVPLADGRALVTGGLNDDGESYSSTYIFDPAQGTWLKAGLLGTARTAPAAAVLADGRVLIAGGYFAIKPTSDVDSTPGITLAAYHPGSPDGGGSQLNDVEPPHVGAALATAEIYDPATDTWSSTGSLVYARTGASALTLADGRVLIVGSAGESSTGVTVDSHAFRAAEIFDPKTGKFSVAGAAAGHRSGGAREAGCQGREPGARR